MAPKKPERMLEQPSANRERERPGSLMRSRPTTLPVTSRWAYVFGQHHEGGGGDDEYGVKVEGGSVELRQLEPGGLDDGRKIDHAHEEGEPRSRR